MEFYQIRECLTLTQTLQLSLRI